MRYSCARQDPRSQSGRGGGRAKADTALDTARPEKSQRIAASAELARPVPCYAPGDTAIAEGLPLPVAGFLL